MKLPFEINLKGKTVVITGAGGILCGTFAKALAEAGASVALLDLNAEAADAVAREIVAGGKTAKAYQCNVLETSSIQEARDAIARDFGTCDILINGAGGNNPKATCDNEYFHPEDLESMDWSEQWPHHRSPSFPGQPYF